MQVRRLRAKYRQQLRKLGSADGLIERDTNVAVAEVAQVDAAPGGALERAGRGNAQRIEKVLVRDRQARLAQRRGKRPCQAMHPLRDGAQLAGTVVDCEHRRGNGEQHLRGADVARRAVTPDVLLARLQRQPQCGRTVGVLRDTYQPAGQPPL